MTRTERRAKEREWWREMAIAADGVQLSGRQKRRIRKHLQRVTRAEAKRAAV